MLVTVTQFARLAADTNANVLPLGGNRTGCQARTSVGAFTALATGTKFVRIATDTNIQLDITGGSTDTADEFFPANSVEYLAVNGGETLTIAATS